MLAQGMPRNITMPFILVIAIFVAVVVAAPAAAPITAGLLEDISDGIMELKACYL
ncbi:hypothetical protein M434DRAFT_26656 [Hypoxylon sp. CO27-5]|nr:hypothetical protein M434DRAFT_26656 [Hypoxylon sp. CO27-5]